MATPFQHIKIAVFVVLTGLACIVSAQDATDAEEVQRCEAAKAVQEMPPQMTDISCEEIVSKSKPRRTKVVKVVEKSDK